MDEQLAAIYGTGMPDEEDLSKTASAELLVKLAEEEGVDLNDFSDEEIAEMITNLQGEEKTAGEDDSQEKLAEADYLGRVMAHAMVQELGEIEKEAGPRWEAVKGGAGKVWGAMKGVGSKAKAQAAGLREGAVGAKHAITGKSYGRKLPKDVRKALGREAYEAAKPGLKTLGATAALGGAFGVGRASKGGKKKKASALAKLAEDRAYEILAENGWVDEDGAIFEPPQQEKTASQLDFAVEQEALQMLEAAGYPVQWNEE